MNLFRRLIPATLAARFFWGIAAASLISAVAIWSWLYSRFYDTLDREASFRMKQMADAVLSEVSQVRLSDNYNDQRHELLSRFWQFEKSAGLVQNLYWLDLTGDRPVFIASFSQTLGVGSFLQPPASEDIEDLVYDYINDLDRGEMVFPDPYAYGVERRFKIVLCPVLDANGLLESVVGIEADMEYLKLAGEFRNILAEGVGLAVLISLLISFLLAGNLSAKITIFGRNVDLISKGHKPEDLHLTIKELDELYQAFVKMAADLEQQRAHVKQVFSRKLDELAFTGGAIAHEIRNPLSAIEMHFGLLKRSLNRDAAEQDCQVPVEEIDQQLHHLRRLLTTFLNYSRKVLPQSEMVNLHEFLSRVINARRQVLGDFAVEIVAGNDVCAGFDPVMLQQVIENLVNNSFRAAGDKHLKITISAALSDCMLQIKIADNGPGIAAQMREQLFTPFASGNLDGNGFGLALCRKLVEAHGGEIYHQENSDSGAVFVIEVPQHENSGS